MTEQPLSAVNVNSIHMLSFWLEQHTNNSTAFGRWQHVTMLDHYGRSVCFIDLGLPFLIFEFDIINFHVSAWNTLGLCRTVGLRARSWAVLKDGRFLRCPTTRHLGLVSLRFTACSLHCADRLQSFIVCVVQYNYIFASSSPLRTVVRFKALTH